MGRLVALVGFVAASLTFAVGCRHEVVATPVSAAPTPAGEVTYERLTASQPPPFASKPLVAYRGDAGALESAGGVPIGELALTVPAATSDDDAAAKAADEAAKHGGTHVIRIDRADASETTLDEGATRRKRFWWALSGFGDVENCKNGDMRACRHQLEPAPEVYRTEAKHRVRYLVVTVPPARWLDLPAALRPAPL